MPALVKWAAYLHENSIAPSTRSTYDAAKQSWWRFADAAGFRLPDGKPSVPLYPPFEQQTIAIWLAWQSLSLAPSTCQVYLYGIQKWHSDFGFPSPIVGSELIRSILRGSKRVYGTRQAAAGETRLRLPITAKVLQDFRPHIDASSRAGAIIWAAFTMGTFGLLRSGEFTVKGSRDSLPPSPANEQDAGVLRWRHITWFDDQGQQVRFEGGWFAGTVSEYRLQIPSSKTDPFRQSVTIRIVTPTAVRALRDLAEMPPGTTDPNLPIFCMPDSSEPMTRDHLIGEIRRCASAAGLNPDHFNGHSFRKGGAETLADAGIRDNVIKVMGRWSSDCYQLYIKESSDSIRTAGLAMEPIPRAPPQSLARASFPLGTVPLDQSFLLGEDQSSRRIQSRAL